MKSLHFITNCYYSSYNGTVVLAHIFQVINITSNIYEKILQKRMKLA